MEMVERRIEDAVSRFMPRGEDPDLAGLKEWYQSKFGVPAGIDGGGKDSEQVIDELLRSAGVAYEDRERILGLTDLRAWIGSLARRYMPEHGDLVKNFGEFSRQVKDRTDIAVPESLVTLPQDQLIDSVAEKIANERKEQVLKRGSQMLRSLERGVLLDRIDDKWKEMLYNMDQLRDIVGMRSFAQQDPKLEYKRDATELFGSMMASIDDDVTSLVYRMSEVPEDHARFARRWQASEFRKDEVGQFAMAGGGGGGGNGQDANPEDEKPVPVRVEKKPGRNEPCWCSSGKKYKKCHWPN
jgi:preprotein translocase subunit SecA